MNLVLQVLIEEIKQYHPILINNRYLKKSNQTCKWVKVILIILQSLKQLREEMKEILHFVQT